MNDRSNFHPKSRPDILATISLDDDSPKHVISIRIADVTYHEIYGYRAIGVFLVRRVKAHAGSDAQKSATAFFPPSFPSPLRRAALLRRVSLPRIFSVSSVPHTIVFMRPRLLTPPPALRRARSVYAGCIRVGEVRDPRVITGLSRGTYINPSSPSTYISLPGIAQELVEVSSVTM